MGTKEQRTGVESLMKTALSTLTSDLAGTYYPLTGMDEKVRQQLVDDHFLFASGDRNLIVAGMERDWPEGRGIFHNAAKTFLLWVNEEDQTRIISMEKGGDVKGVFARLARGIQAVGDSVKAECGKEFALSEQYGYIHSCPTNLGTGMRASVHVDLPGWTKESVDKLKARCEELAVQPRGTRGESGGQTGCTYDISNKHRLGYSEVQLVQVMIDGVNTLYKEVLESLCSPASTTSSISCTPSVPSSTGTSVRAWRRVSSPRPVRISPPSRRTMRRLALRPPRVKAKRRATVMSSKLATAPR